MDATNRTRTERVHSGRPVQSEPLTPSAVLRMGHLTFLKWFGRQRWLRQGIRERIIKLALGPMLQSNYVFEVDLFGCAYTGEIKNWIDRNILFFGIYEREVLELIKRLAACGSGKVFVDVGANVGLHALWASRYFASVHAFEPYPPVRARLLDLIERNDIPNIIVHDVGLGSEKGELPFFSPSEENVGTGSFIPEYSGLNTPYGTLRVAVGDEYLQDDVDGVDVLKIDVEGYEPDVLRGFRRTLERYRPHIVMELSNVTKRQLGDVGGLFALLPKGYCAFDICGREILAGLFERQTLRLTYLEFARCNNNILLVPEERLTALREQQLI